MGLATVFKLSIYILTAFVGLALGFAENGPIAFISIPVTLIAYLWCEVASNRDNRVHGMSETLAIVMGFFALLAATFEFFSENQEGKLLAGIHLVVYLTWIVLLQTKSNYRYWLLMALGVMHIAVGSVLTNSTWYGLCMVIYLFGAIWTLSVFSLYRVSLEFAPIDKSMPGAPISPSTGRLGDVFNAVRLEDHSHWISLRLVTGTLMTSVAGLFIGAVFFALIPRVWVGTALGITDESLPPGVRRSVTGQMSEIKLGDMGHILESNDPVLALRIVDNQTTRRMSAQKYAESLGLSEPLFRGAVLTDYSDGGWRPETIGNSATTTLAMAPPEDSNIQTVRQEIHLYPVTNDALLCLGRPVAMQDLERTRVANIQLTDSIPIRRTWFKKISGPVDYIAFSPLTVDEQGIVPTQPEMVAYSVNKYIPRCSRLSTKLQRLRVLTQEIIAAEEARLGRKLKDLEKAKLLESYLRDSRAYIYSLDAPVVDPKADPVEDFLFNRKAGHCQYFASALALMLRAADVPARLVAGFKGGEELPDGSLNVEKRYAHVWVEAWIDKQRWLTFDATPEDGREESVSAIGSKRNLWTTMTSKLAGIWQSSVLDITLERQEESIYQPLRDFVANNAKIVRDFRESPSTAIKNLVRVLTDPKTWLSIPGLIAFLLLGGTSWLAIRNVRWLRRLWTRKSVEAAAPDQLRIQFYERFVQLMQSRGQVREPAQTQLEFVDQVNETLARTLGATQLEFGLHSLGEVFYHVRFGAGELSAQDAAKIDSLLNRLEQVLNPETRVPATA